MMMPRYYFIACVLTLLALGGARSEAACPGVATAVYDNVCAHSPICQFAFRHEGAAGVARLLDMVHIGGARLPLAPSLLGMAAACTSVSATYAPVSAAAAHDLARDLALIKTFYVDGTHVCLDDFATPVCDTETQQCKCICVPGHTCIHAESEGTGVTTASVDLPYTLAITALVLISVLLVGVLIATWWMPASTMTRLEKHLAAHAGAELELTTGAAARMRRAASTRYA